MYRFDFTTDTKISLIRALRTASTGSDRTQENWPLKFSKDVVERGIITETDYETVLMVALIKRAEKEMAVRVFCGVTDTFTWTMTELAHTDKPVLFVNRYA